jgi:hypothetical protein
LIGTRCPTGSGSPAATIRRPTALPFRTAEPVEPVKIATPWPSRAGDAGPGMFTLANRVIDLTEFACTPPDSMPLPGIADRTRPRRSSDDLGRAQPRNLTARCLLAPMATATRYTATAAPAGRLGSTIAVARPRTILWPGCP